MKKFFLCAGLVLMTGCTASEPVFMQSVQAVKISQTLLEPVLAEPFSGYTNEDLLLHTLLLQERLHTCNSRLEAIKNSIE